MKISKELKVGVVAILAITVLVWGYNYLKGANLFTKSTSAYAIYPKVPGLSVSAPIIINGVQSGVVEAIYFHPDRSSRVIVKLRIAKSVLKIPKNSVADLISTDFLGSKAIGLNLGDSELELQDGDTLQSHFEKSMLTDVSEQILPIKNKAENLVDSLQIAVAGFESLMEDLSGVFTDRNKKNLSDALANLNGAVLEFNSLAKNLNSMMDNSIKPTMESYKKLGDSLALLDIAGTLEKAQGVFSEMTVALERINNGEGTMGQLMTNDSLYNNLTGATQQMEELMEDIKLHPKRYFRILSRKEIPYKKE